MFLETRIKENTYKRIKNNKEIEYRRSKKIYILKCDSCNVEFEKDSNRSFDKLINQKSHFCNQCFTFSLASSLGKASRAKNICASIGEKYIDANGYVVIRMNADANYSGLYIGKSSALIREHVKVMQDSIGRKLKKNEVVHHIDGNKLNNDISNLDLCTQEQHNNCHGKSKEIIFELYKKGIVKYNKITKLYYV